MRKVLFMATVAFMTCHNPVIGQITDPGIGVPVPGRDPVNFTYDAAGNRIMRTVGLTVKPLSDDDDGINTCSTEYFGEEEGFGMSEERVIRVYPNPVRDELTVDTGNGDEDEHYRLLLFDASGRLLKEIQRRGNGREPVDMSMYPSGTYFLIIDTSDKKFEYKILKI